MILMGWSEAIARSIEWPWINTKKKNILYLLHNIPKIILQIEYVGMHAVVQQELHNYIRVTT